VRLLIVLLLASSAYADEVFSTNRSYQSLCTDVSIAVFQSAEVCVDWYWQFGHCSSTGPKPGFPCATDSDCGTSTPCMTELYEARADIVKVPTQTAPSLRAHHITSRTASRACALVVNEDLSHAQAGTLCIEALRADQ